MNEITIILTSCNRFDLLRRTLESFFANNTYPIKEVLIRDDSGMGVAIDQLSELKFDIKSDTNILVLNDSRKLGQLRSIDVMMNMVQTDYIMHLEDDWEFYRPDFLNKAIEIMNECKDIVQVWFRPKKDGFKHDILPGRYYTKKNKYPYKLIQKSGVMTGFSWNPHLRRKSDYIKPYSEIGKEYHIGKFYSEYKTAILEEGYCRHIGGGRTAHMDISMRG